MIGGNQLIPRLRGTLWSFVDKKDKSKHWHGWSVEVGSLDVNKMWVSFQVIESHTQKPKPMLYKSEEEARKAMNKKMAEVKRILESTFQRQRLRRNHGLILPGRN